MRALAIVALIGLAGGCRGTVHMAQASGFHDLGKPGEREIVTSSAEQHTVMGIVDDTLYVDAAWQSLQRQCARGELNGITVETSTQLGFFQWTNRISMRGVCVTKVPKPQPIAPEDGGETPG